MDNNEIEVKPPQISEETLKSMTQFFLRTSIPRMIEKAKQKQADEDKAKKEQAS